MRIRTLAKARQREPARAYLNDQGDLGRFLPAFGANLWCSGAGPTMLGADQVSVETDERSSSSPRPYASSMGTRITRDKC
jgi:hypothetical protein